VIKTAVSTMRQARVKLKSTLRDAGIKVGGMGLGNGMKSFMQGRNVVIKDRGQQGGKK
jgi:hypothetical protein